MGETGGKSMPQIQLRDLHQRGDVLINRQGRGSTGQAVVGDVLQFGQPGQVAPTTLFLHLDPCLEAW